MSNAIQRTELKTFYYTPVHCPFCGTRVMGADPVDETHITACPHTLFIAHDMAFEYRSPRLDENLNFQVDPGEKKVYFEISDYSNTVFFENPH